jgi:hypothetical protein
MAKEPLEPETVDQLKDLFSQMDLDGNRNITWEEAEAFFLQLFDELPQKTIEQSYRRMPRVGIAPPAEALSAVADDLIPILWNVKRDELILWCKVWTNQTMVCH